MSLYGFTHTLTDDVEVLLVEPRGQTAIVMEQSRRHNIRMPIGDA